MEDLVDVSRISSGNITLQMDDIDLVELVRQTGGEFNEKLEQKGLNVISKIPKGSGDDLCRWKTAVACHRKFV